MRKSIINGILMSAMAVAAVGCSENSWNDKLDGFKDLLNSEGTLPAVDVQTINYTFTDADYEALASNSTIKALATTDEEAAALKLVGKMHCFNAEAPASKYAAAWFGNTSSQFFTLSNGSAIKLTYQEALDVPAELAALTSASEYVVSDEDYAKAWDNGDEYIDAFTPSVSPARKIPQILLDVKPEAQAGDFTIVNYMYSEQEPIFATVGGDEPEGFVPSSVIATVELNQTVDINAVVTAKSTNGMIVTDKSGSIFVYMGNSFEYDAYQIGDQLVINGTISSYNLGFQVAGSSAVIEKVGHEDYAYPSPKVLSGADLDVVATRSADEVAVYAQISGTVAVSNKNINIKVAGAEKAEGSLYSSPEDIKALCTDGAEVTLTGYLIAVAKGQYCNFVVTNITPAANKAPGKDPVVSVSTTNINSVWMFNGSKWSEATGVLILQPSDYRAMGQKYNNLSEDLPELLLPEYLKVKQPYAQAGDETYVLYAYYSGKTAYRCAAYKYDGTNWAVNTWTETQTAQFVRSNGVWNYDPSVTITLPAGKSQPLSTLYYQTCVDWVKANIGAQYVTSYGNNEYYCGTSAYQGNVDLRPEAARSQYAAGYEGMSNEEIEELEKQRFAFQVMPAALSILHSDAKPIDGLEVIYTINFYVYINTTTEYTIRYRVSAPATFEMIDCTWWEGGEPATRLDLSKYLK